MRPLLVAVALASVSVAQSPPPIPAPSFEVASSERRPIAHDAD